MYRGVVASVRRVRDYASGGWKHTYDIDYDDGDKDRNLDEKWVLADGPVTPGGRDVRRRGQGDDDDAEDDVGGDEGARGHPFAKGDRVKAHFRNNPAKRKYAGVVVGVHRLRDYATGGWKYTYDVDYDDGDKDRGLSQGNVELEDGGGGSGSAVRRSPVRKARDDDGGDAAGGTEHPLAKGDAVLARFRGDARKRMYRGVVASVRRVRDYASGGWKHTYDIDYDDGDKDRNLDEKWVLADGPVTPGGRDVRRRGQGDDDDVVDDVGGDEGARGHPFAKGDRVKAHFRNNPAKRKYAGVVVGVHRLRDYATGGWKYTYDVDYDDGDKDRGLSQGNVELEDGGSGGSGSVVRRSPVRKARDDDGGDAAGGTEHPLAKGDAVLARFRGDARKRMYCGVVASVRRVRDYASGGWKHTYDIDYDDGDKDRNLDEKWVLADGPVTPGGRDVRRRGQGDDDDAEDDVGGDEGARGHPFAKGDRVKAHFRNNPAKRKYAGVVVGVHRLRDYATGGWKYTYDVDYDDGDKDRGLSQGNVELEDGGGGGSGSVVRRSPVRKARDDDGGDAAGGTEHPLAKGDAVLARFRGDARKRMYCGVVASVRRVRDYASGGWKHTYDIDYDDGDKDRNLDEKWVLADGPVTPGGRDVRRRGQGDDDDVVDDVGGDEGARGHPFAKGDRVKAHFRNNPAKRKYAGVVVGVHRLRDYATGGWKYTYDVDYDDGDKDRGLSQGNVELEDGGADQLVPPSRDRRGRVPDRPKSNIRRRVPNRRDSTASDASDASDASRNDAPPKPWQRRAAPRPKPKPRPRDRHDSDASDDSAFDSARRGEKDDGPMRPDRRAAPRRRPPRHEDQDDDVLLPEPRRTRQPAAPERTPEAPSAPPTQALLPGLPLSNVGFAVRQLDAPTQLSGIVSRGRAFVVDAVLSLLRSSCAGGGGVGDTVAAAADALLAIDPNMSTERLGSRGFSIAEVKHMLSNCLGGRADAHSALSTCIQITLSTLSAAGGGDVVQPRDLAELSCGCAVPPSDGAMREVMALVASLAAHVVQQGPQLTLLFRAHFVVAELEALASQCDELEHGDIGARVMTGCLPRRAFLSTLSSKLNTKDPPAAMPRGDAHLLADAFAGPEGGTVDYLAFTRCLAVEVAAACTADSINHEHLHEAVGTLCGTLKNYYMGPYSALAPGSGTDSEVSSAHMLGWLEGGYTGAMLGGSPMPPLGRTLSWLRDMCFLAVPEPCMEALAPGTPVGDLLSAAVGGPSLPAASGAGDAAPPAGPSTAGVAAPTAAPPPPSYQDPMELHVAEHQMGAAFRVVAQLRSAEVARLAAEGGDTPPEQLSEDGCPSTLEAFTAAAGGEEFGDKEALGSALLGSGALTTVKHRRALKSVFKDRRGGAASAEGGVRFCIGDVGIVLYGGAADALGALGKWHTEMATSEPAAPALPGGGGGKPHMHRDFFAMLEAGAPIPGSLGAYLQQEATPQEKARLYEVLAWLSDAQQGRGSLTLSQTPDNSDMWSMKLGGRLNLGLRFFVE